MAQEFIEGEYGKALVMGTSFDMSSNTDLEFTFLKPDCVTTLTKVGLLGTVPFPSEFGTFAANEWAFYTFIDGDLDQVGTWQVRLRYRDATPAQFYSTLATFEVVERAPSS